MKLRKGGHTHTYYKPKKYPGHLQALIEGFGQMLKVPGLSCLVVGILGFALLVAVGFYVVQHNMAATYGAWNKSAEIALYLKQDAQSNTLREQLAKRQRVAQVELITPEQGIQYFIAQAGLKTILTGFKNNPLPPLLLVYPKLGEVTLRQLEELVAELQQLPGVATVKWDRSWAERSQHLLLLAKRLAAFLGPLLLGGALLVIGVTTYITAPLIKQRLVTTARVLRYQCWWYGVISGLVVLIILNYILLVAQHAGVVLQGLGAKGGIGVILFNSGIGAISAGISLRRTTRAKIS